MIISVRYVISAFKFFSLTKSYKTRYIFKTTLQFVSNLYLINNFVNGFLTDYDTKFHLNRKYAFYAYIIEFVVPFSSFNLWKLVYYWCHHFMKECLSDEKGNDISFRHITSRRYKIISRSPRHWFMLIQTNYTKQSQTFCKEENCEYFFFLSFFLTECSTPTKVHKVKFRCQRDLFKHLKTDF